MEPGQVAEFLKQGKLIEFREAVHQWNGQVPIYRDPVTGDGYYHLAVKLGTVAPNMAYMIIITVANLIPFVHANELDNEGYSALGRAVQIGDPTVVGFMVNLEGVDVNAGRVPLIAEDRNDPPMAPLYVAMRSNEKSATAIFEIIAARKDLNTHGGSTYNPWINLFALTTRWKNEMLQVMLRMYPKFDINLPALAAGILPLQRLFEKLKDDMIEIIVASGRVTRAGDAPIRGLIIACRDGGGARAQAREFTDVIKLMVQLPGLELAIDFPANFAPGPAMRYLSYILTSVTASALEAWVASGLSMYYDEAWAHEHKAQLRNASIEQLFALYPHKTDGAGRIIETLFSYWHPDMYNAIDPIMPFFMAYFRDPVATRAKCQIANPKRLMPSGLMVRKKLMRVRAMGRAAVVDYKTYLGVINSEDGVSDQWVSLFRKLAASKSPDDGRQVVVKVSPIIFRLLSQQVAEQVPHLYQIMTEILPWLPVNQMHRHMTALGFYLTISESIDPDFVGLPIHEVNQPIFMFNNIMEVKTRPMSNNPHLSFKAFLLEKRPDFKFQSGDNVLETVMPLLAKWKSDRYSLLELMAIMARPEFNVNNVVGLSAPFLFVLLRKSLWELLDYLISNYIEVDVNVHINKKSDPDMALTEVDLLDMILRSATDSKKKDIPTSAFMLVAHQKFVPKPHFNEWKIMNSLKNFKQSHVVALMELWIGAGKPLDHEMAMYDALEYLGGEHEVMALLREYAADPEGTRTALRLKYKYASRPGHIFISWSGPIMAFA